MKKLFVFILTVLVGITIITRPVAAKDYPKAVGYVNDFADIISQSVEMKLEAELSSFEASTSNELAVVTLSSLEDDVIENVAVELFEQWGIGKKKQDNGVLLLIAPNERELKIEVGYGLESALTDSRAGNIIRTVITPEFKKEDYDAGVSQGVKAIKIALTDDPSVFDIVESKTSGSSEPISIIIMVGGTLLTIYAVAFLSRSKRWWPGGVIGGGIGFFFGLSNSVIWGIIGAVCLGAYGLFLDYIFSQNYKTRKSKGLPTSWWSSGGGFSSGGGGSSFGGFSGGSSGGGGASGSW